MGIKIVVNNLAKIFVIIFMGHNIAMADSVDINITGKVLSTPCSVDTSSVSKEVNFGQLHGADLKNSGSTSAWQSFQIKLNNCPALINKATVTFNGNPSGVDPTLFVNEGTATNVAVQMAEDGNKSVVLSNNSSMTVDVDAQHSATYALAGRVYSVNSNAGGGTISSVVQMNFTYQ